MSVVTEIGTVQFLRYVPSSNITPRESMGAFEFPLVAVVRYLDEIVREYQWSPYRFVLRDIVQLSKHNRDVLHLNDFPDLKFGDFDAANLIDRGSFSAFCPICDTYFSPSQIVRENWSFQRGKEFAGGGRCYTCSEGHVLLNNQDWKT